MCSLKSLFQISRGFRARNYVVIPLGASAGLIQWVDGAVPMFSVFKEVTLKWCANP